MDEYIDREAAIRAVLNDSTEQVGYSREDAADCIRYMDAADVAPVVHGRWEVSTDEWLGTDVSTCSKCRESYVLVEGTPKENLWNYCPNCGAQMHEDDFCSYGECREGKDEK